MPFHPHTVFAFNTALIKDIAYYEDLEKSIKTVYQSFEIQNGIIIPYFNTIS